MPSSLFGNNPVSQVTGRTTNPTTENLLTMAKANGNPMAFLLSVACRNPDVNRVLSANNGDYAAAVQQISKERGLDVNSLLQQASSLQNSFFSK